MKKITSKFSALKIKNYRNYNAGQAINLMGTWMTQLSLTWWLHEITQSVWMVALLACIIQLPILILSPFWSAWILTKKKPVLIQQVQWVQWVWNLILLGFFIFKINQPWILLCWAAISGSLNALEIIVKQDIIGRLIPHHLLAQSVGLNSVFSNSVRLIGPMITGIILWVGSPGWAFAATALSYMIMVAVLHRLDWQTIYPNETPIRKTMSRHVFKHWMDGVRQGVFLCHRFPEIKKALITMSMVSLFIAAYTSLMPALLHRRFNVEGYQYADLTALSGAGSLMMCIVFVIFQWQPRLIQMKWMVVFILCNAFLLAWVSQMWMIKIILFNMGAALIGLNLIGSIFMQEQIEHHDRIKLMSLFAMMTLGVVPIGSLFLGGLASWVGEDAALMVASVTALMSFIFFNYRWSSSEKENGAVNMVSEVKP